MLVLHSGPFNYSPTSGRAVLHLKLVSKRCRIQFSVAPIDLAVQIPTSRKYRLRSLRKTPRGGHSTYCPRSLVWQLGIILQHNPTLSITIIAVVIIYFTMWQLEVWFLPNTSYQSYFLLYFTCMNVLNTKSHFSKSVSVLGKPYSYLPA